MTEERIVLIDLIEMGADAGHLARDAGFRRRAIDGARGGGTHGRGGPDEPLITAG